MSKAILSPGRFLPTIIGTIISHLRNARKIIESALSDSNNKQLQNIPIKKRQNNHRPNTDGRKSYRAGNFH